MKLPSLPGGLRRLTGPDCRHFWLLLYWPVFSLIFNYLERHFPAVYYYPMHCRLDDLIPFCEWFVIPYVLWFPFVAGMLVYTFRHKVPAFRRLMWFIILTYSTALLIYVLVPNCQYLRPVVFPRDNILVRITAWLYASDTNTNVCPSIHVMGSLGVYFAARDVWRNRPLLRRLTLAAALLICVSTVFMKQHSVLDVAAGALISAVVWQLVYGAPRRSALPAVPVRAGVRRSS